MAGVSAGSLDRELLLQSPTGADGLYADEEGCWGSLRGAFGNELLRFTTPLATAAFVVTLHYRTDLRSDWRIAVVDEDTPRYLQIASFHDPDGSRQQLNVYCVEVV